MRKNNVNILKIGISGHIGSGKSLAIKFFRSKKYPAYDLDNISREIMSPGEKCYKKIIKLFGSDILYKNKNLNRNKIKKIIFKDYKIREKYNSIVHPEIFNKVKEYVKFHVSNKDHIIFFEGALIAKKTKIGKYLDKIILIKSRKDKIIARVSKRDRMETDEIFNILEAQTTTEVNTKDFDYIINNNDKIDDFKKQIKFNTRKNISLDYIFIIVFL